MYVMQQQWCRRFSSYDVTASLWRRSRCNAAAFDDSQVTTSESDSVFNVDKTPRVDNRRQSFTLTVVLRASYFTPSTESQSCFNNF